MKYPLNGRTIDESGVVVFDDNGLVDLLYENEIDISNVIAMKSDETEKYNKFCIYFNSPSKVVKHIDELDIDIHEIDSQLKEDWLIPDKYKNMDIRKYVHRLCNTMEERTRADEEFLLYEKYNMMDLLRCLVYLVDIMRYNNIVWGVGRGSSAASYILYLIGVHKINSLEYDLDIDEFLRG